MESLQTFLFIIQIILSLIIVLFVLLQQTDEDSLSGIGGGAANAKMLSKRSLGSPISKMTMVVFILFMFNSLLLATISARNFNKNNSTIETFIEENKNTVSNEKTNNKQSSKDIIDDKTEKQNDNVSDKKVEDNKDELQKDNNLNNTTK